MPFRLTLAFSVSILLIGVASWSRFATAQKAPAALAIVERADIDLNDSEEVLNDFLSPKTATTTESLSPTDVMGRQLILDYVELASSGGAGTESINALANKYIESIPTLNRALVLSYADLKTVTNTKANFQNYAERITEIYNSYKQNMQGVEAVKEGVNPLNPALYSSVLAFSETYSETANELENLPVPGALAQSHLSLINIYLSNAEAMKAVANTEQDSATAFAGLLALNENLSVEQTLLNEITEILTSNDI